jgi:CHAT domain-containing protein
MPAAAGRVMVVTMPHTPGAADLPGATTEAERLRDLLPGKVEVLEGPQATHDSVTAALPHCPWAHFACHGQSDLADPSASHLLLHDHQAKPLNVVDVTRLWLDRAELAFLSACSTSRSGARLADEAIHLAAAFQLAGYRHVIATLWPIGDRPAVRIATNIYRTLTSEDTDDVAIAAEALHAATRRQRAIQLDRPSTWAAHLHNGA